MDQWEYAKSGGSPFKVGKQSGWHALSRQNPAPVLWLKPLQRGAWRASGPLSLSLPVLHEVHHVRSDKHRGFHTHGKRHRVHHIRKCCCLGVPPQSKCKSHHKTITFFVKKINKTQNLIFSAHWFSSLVRFSTHISIVTVMISYHLVLEAEQRNLASALLPTHLNSLLCCDHTLCPGEIVSGLSLFSHEQCW